MAYDYHATQSGQGNWNTGGAYTGTGSLKGGIQGVSPQYTVAPWSMPGGPSVTYGKAPTTPVKGMSGGGVVPRPVAPRPVAPMIPPAFVPPVPKMPKVPQAPPNPFGWMGQYPPVDNVTALQNYLQGVTGNKFHATRTAPTNIQQGQTVYKNQDFPPRSGVGGLTNNPASPQGRTGFGFGGGGGGGW